VDRILGRLRRAGLEHWTEGGHWAWLALSLVIWILRRTRRRERGVVATVPIRAGDRYLVTLVDPTEARACADT